MFRERTMRANTSPRTASGRLGLAVGVLALAAAPALAQTSGDPPLKNLESAREFRNITATGVTKPPGRAGGERPRESAEPDSAERRLDRKIGSGICTGCN